MVGLAAQTRNPSLHETISLFVLTGSKDLAGEPDYPRGSLPLILFFAGVPVIAASHDRGSRQETLEP